MLNFGTSAYLKLLALNPKPRDTELRNRLSKVGGGYDFHKQMRRIVTHHASGISDWETTQHQLAAIKKLPERASATNAVKNLSDWLGGRPIRLLDNCDKRTVSPAELFSVKFSPDFETDINGIPMRVHIWNTIRPNIRLREAVGTIGLFAAEGDAFSLGVLSLRTGELFSTANAASANELASLLARDIEGRIERLTDEISEKPREDRPGKAAFH